MERLLWMAILLAATCPAICVYYPFMTHSALYSDTRTLVVEGANVISSIESINIAFSASVANPSLCLCIQKMSVTQQEGTPASKFYIFPNSLTNTMFTVRILSGLKYQLSDTQIRYLVFDQLNTLISETFSLAASYQSLSTDNLSFNLDKHEQISYTHTPTYTPPSTRLGTAPSIGCIVYILGEDVSFNSENTSDYWVRASCSMEYEQSSVTVGVTISSNIFMNRMWVSVITFLRNDGAHFSLFNDLLWIPRLDIVSGIEELVQIVPTANSSFIFGLSSLSISDPHQPYHYQFDRITGSVTVSNEGSVESSKSNGFFISIPICDSLYSRINGACLDDLCSNGTITLQPLSSSSATQSIRPLPRQSQSSHTFLALSNSSPHFLDIDSLSGTTNITESSIYNDTTYNIAPDSRIVAGVDSAGVLLTDEGVWDASEGVLYPITLANQSLIGDAEGLVAFDENSVLFLALAQDCGSIYVHGWGRGLNVSYTRVPLPVLPGTQCDNLRVLSKQTEILESELSGISLWLQILEQSTSQLSLLSLSLNYSYLPNISLTEAGWDLSTPTSLQLHGVSAVVLLHSNNHAMFELPFNTSATLYEPTASYYENRQHYIYLITGQGQIKIFHYQVENGYVEIGVDAGPSGYLYETQKIEIVYTSEVHMGSSEDGRVLVIATDTSLLYLLERVGTGNFVVRDALDVSAELPALATIEEVAVSHTGDKLMLRDDGGKLYLIDCLFHVKDGPQFEYTAEQIVIPEDENNGGDGEDRGGGQSDAEEEVEKPQNNILIIGIGAGGGGAVAIIGLIVACRLLRKPEDAQVSPQEPGKKARREKTINTVINTRSNILHENNKDLPESLEEFADPQMNSTGKTNPYYSSGRGLIHDKDRSLIIEDLD